MSESKPESPAMETPADQQPRVEATATDAATETPPADLGDAGKKAIDAMKAERDAARREARTNADAAKKLAEFEGSQKTEQQKIADRAAAAERERDEAKADGLRYKAAAKHRIDEDNFDLLGSGDEDTIDDRAQRVGDLLKVRSENEQLKAELEALRAGKPAPASGRPTEALKPGATPSAIEPPSSDAYPQQFLPRRMRDRMGSTNT